MGKVGMVGSDLEGARTPPANPLLKALYYQEQTTLSPIAGIFKEYQQRKEGYDPENYWLAMARGFKQHTTFDDIVKNPWLAFALNVGADPVTWIPGAYWAKGWKGLATITGAKKAYEMSKGLKAIDSLDSWFGKRFGGPNFEIKKRNPEAVREAILRRNIDFDDFVSTFVKNEAEQVHKLALNEDESFQLYRLLQATPTARTLTDHLGKMQPELINMYNALSPGGKAAYRLSWENKFAMEKILASRQMQGMNVYETMKERVRDQYKTFVSTPNEMLANEVGLDEILKRLDPEQATVGEIVEHLSPAQALSEIVDLIPSIGKAYKGLATLAVRAGTEKKFLSAVRGLPKDGFERTVADNILRDEQILEFRSLFEHAVAHHGSEDAAAERVAGEIARNPKGKFSQTWKKITGVKPKFSKDIRNQVPSSEQVLKVANRIPISTPYKGLRDFYRQMRVSTDIGDQGLNEALRTIGKTMPQELKTTMSIPEIMAARAELLGMKDPEAIAALVDQWNALNKNRFNGLPLNVIRQADMKTIAKINLHEIEVRMASALQVEGIAAARAVSNDNYHRWLFNWLKERGLLIAAEDFRDLRKRTEFFKRMKEILPEKEFKTRSLEGFTEITSHPIFHGFALPQSLANEINAYTRLAGDPGRIEKFFEFWGRYQSLWKAMQLAYFPSYHFRNAISNVWNNFLFGMDDPRDLQFYWEAMRLQKKMAGASMAKGKFGGGLTEEEIALIRDLNRGVIGGEYAGELRQVLDRANPFRHRFRLRSFEETQSVFQKGYEFGTAIENNARIAHYLKARHGMKMTHEDAVKSVYKYLFDYRRGLTQFEDKYLRNALIPFYAWTRFNMPLQLEMLAMQPGKFSSVAKLRRAIESQWGGPDPDTQFQADWFRKAFNVRVRYNDETGSYEYFFLDSWLPAADISKLLDSQLGRDAVVSLIGPAKVPFEVLWNYNIFKKRKIERYKGERVPLHLPGGKTLDIPAKLEFLARQLRVVNEADRFLDEEVDISDTARIARLFVGRSYPYNPDQQREWWLYKLNTQSRELKGFYNRAIERDDLKEAERIEKLLTDIEELQDYYK